MSQEVENSAVAELVRAASDGDQDAWDALVERYSGMLWAIARGHRLNTADAGEVVQICWLRLVEHLDRIRDPAKVGSWLATTARRECWNTLRQGGRQVPTDSTAFDVEAADTDHSVEGVVIDAERDRLLWEALEHVPDHCRTLLRVLMADTPPSYEQVSAALDMPVGSIGPTRARCLRRLREHVEAAGITGGMTPSVE